MRRGPKPGHGGRPPTADRGTLRVKRITTSYTVADWERIRDQGLPGERPGDTQLRLVLLALDDLELPREHTYETPAPTPARGEAEARNGWVVSVQSDTIELVKDPYEAHVGRYTGDLRVYRRMGTANRLVGVNRGALVVSDDTAMIDEAVRWLCRRFG